MAYGELAEKIADHFKENKKRFWKRRKEARKRESQRYSSVRNSRRELLTYEHE